VWRCVWCFWSFVDDRRCGRRKKLELVIRSRIIRRSWFLVTEEARHILPGNDFFVALLSVLIIIPVLARKTIVHLPYASNRIESRRSYTNHQSPHTLVIVKGFVVVVCILALLERS
jgi:hypothetical protein